MLAYSYLFLWIITSSLDSVETQNDNCEITIAGTRFWGIFQDRKNHQDAQKECERYGGTLAVFDSATWTQIQNGLPSSCALRGWIGPTTWPAHCKNKCCQIRRRDQAIITESCSTPRRQFCMTANDQTTTETLTSPRTTIGSETSTVFSTVSQTAGFLQTSSNVLSESTNSDDTTTDTSTKGISTVKANIIAITTTSGWSNQQTSSEDLTSATTTLADMTTFGLTSDTTPTAQMHEYTTTPSELTTTLTQPDVTSGITETSPDVPSTSDATTSGANLDMAPSTSATSDLTTSPDETTSDMTTAMLTSTTPDENITTISTENIRCPNVDKVQNSLVKVTGFTVGSAAIYTCDQGYKVHEGGTTRSISCTISGEWHYGGFKCSRANKCTELARIIASDSKGFQQTESSFQDNEGRIQIKCKGNARMPNGQRSMTFPCEVDKGLDMYVCKEPRCEPVPFIANSTIGAHTSDVGTNVTVFCDPTFRFPDGDKNKTYACEKNQMWGITAGDICREDTCDALPTIPFSSLNSSLVVVRTHVLITCQTGYMFPDRVISRVVVCLDYMEWNETLPKCAPIKCSQPPELPNGIVQILPGANNGAPTTLNFTTMATKSNNSFDYGTTLLYQCNSGTRLDTGHMTAYSQCAGVGDWNVTSPNCAENRCPSLGIYKTISLNTTLATEGIAVEVNCLQGLHLPDKTSSTIVHCNGTHWSNENLHCKAIICPLPIQINGSFVKDSTGNNYNDTASLGCTKGFFSPDDVTIVCNGDGQWAMVTQPCREVKCPPPPRVPMSIHSLPQTSYAVSDVFQYTCLHGYWYTRDVTSFNITCLQNGAWSKSDPVCKAIACLPIPTWQGANVNTSATTPGTYITVSYTPHGTNTTVTVTSYCNTNGRWDPPVNVSAAVGSLQFKKVPKEASSGRLIGTISLAFVASVASLCPILDLTFFVVYLRVRFYD